MGLEERGERTMATGACGINCDVCRLHLKRSCSTCGPGTSAEAQKKQEAQIRILGAPCPILDCAQKKRITYCLGDCSSFPCEHFKSGPYPYSEGYLAMQERRRKEIAKEDAPSGNPVKVPDLFWEELSQKELAQLCEVAEATPYNQRGLIVTFLNQELLVDIQNKMVMQRKSGKSLAEVQDPLLILICLVYLLNVNREGLSNELVTVRDLKESHFFQGPHAIDVLPLLMRFGHDMPAFQKAAESIGGVPIDMADGAYRIHTFPKVPVYYLLWLGDEEFDPRVSILFDRSIEKHLYPDAILGLVNLVSAALLDSNQKMR